MAIHYENYARFSKGQGFIGSACRPISGQAKSARWTAVDCGKCRATLVGRQVISRHGTVGAVMSADSWGVEIVEGPSGEIQRVDVSAFDDNWAPLPAIEEIFGDARK